MSESTEGGNNSGETPAADEFKPITSQDDLNRIISERVTRERSKFADYRDLKAKAERLDELEQANQTEAEKAATKIAELESQLASTRRESLRVKIAAEHGITDADDIDLFLTGTDEETLTKQAKRLAERTADRKKQGNHAPREGNTPAAGNDERREVVSALFSGD